MNGIVFLILLSSTLATAAEPKVTYQECARNVQTLLQQLYPGKPSQTRARRVFLHTQLACGGLPGDTANAQNWRAQLPPCPLQAPQEGKDGWVGDPAPTVRRFHPGAAACFRKISPRPWDEIAPWLPQVTTRVRAILRRLPPGEQCCFDRADKLVTDGPGAGTPDLIFAHGKSEMDGPEQEEEESLLHRVFSTMDPLLGHYLLDVRIILKKFPHWPQGWQTYDALGWGPFNPKDAKENWGDYPKS